MGKFKLFIPLLIFAVFAVALYLGLGRDPSAMPSALIGKPVPEFALPSLVEAGQTLDRSLFKGRVTLLNVWATWCVSCRVEHPYLLKLASQGVAIVGLDYKDDSAAARQWLVEGGNPYTAVIVDADGHLGVDLGVFGAPETYLVDRDGVIRFKRVGVIDERVWVQELAPLYRNLQ